MKRFLVFVFRILIRILEFNYRFWVTNKLYAAIEKLERVDNVAERSRYSRSSGRYRRPGGRHS